MLPSICTSSARTTLGFLVGLGVGLPSTVGLADETVPQAILQTPLNADLRRRVVRQTSDLTWTLQDTSTPALHETSATLTASELLSTAQAALQTHAARVWIWLESRPEGYRIHLVDAQDERLYQRTITALDTPAATQEAVAVVVRSTLKVLALGVSLDWEIADPAPPPPPIAEPPPPGPKAVLPVPQTPFTWRAALLAQVVPDGLRTHPNVGGHFGWTLRSDWTLWVEAGLGWAGSENSLQSTFDLTRHAGRIGGEYAVWTAPSWTLGVNTAAGVALYCRTTVDTAPDTEATPAQWTVAATAGADVRLRYALIPGWALELHGGADAIFGRPVFQLQTQDSVQDQRSTWPVAPRVGLALVFFSGQRSFP